MIRKITLENFMSHARTEIELSDGLTVLTGPNNCGKSALVAALQVIATGGKTTHVMRHGAKTCRVTVETDDDQTVVWERNKKTVKYSINGEAVHRTGQGVPDSLHDVLKLDRVITKVGASEETHDIHFGQQKSPVFLLDQPGSKSAAFFASSSDASRLIEMQGLHRKQVSDRKTEAKRIEKELAVVTSRIATLDPIKAIDTAIEVAEAKRLAIDAATLRMSKLRAIITSIGQASVTKKRLAKLSQTLRQIEGARSSPEQLQKSRDRAVKLQRGLQAAKLARRTRTDSTAVCKALRPLHAAPSPADTQAIRGLIDRLSTTRRHFKTAASVVECCKTLDTVPSMRDTGNVRGMRSKIEAATDSVQRLRAVCRAIDRLSSPPQPRPTDAFGQLIRRMKTAAITQTCMKHTVALFGPLRVMETPNDPQPLRRCIDRMRPVAARWEDARQAVAAAREEARLNEAAIRKFVQANPKCETCGGDIDPATLMSTLPMSHEHKPVSHAAAENR